LIVFCLEFKTGNPPAGNATGNQSNR